MGTEIIQLVEMMAKFGKLPSLEGGGDNEQDGFKMNETVRTRYIHVWSAGDDGTVMFVFELLVEHKIDLDQLFFHVRIM